MSQLGFAPANPDQGVQTSIREGLQVRRNTKPATGAGFKGVSEWGGAGLQTGCKPGFVACRYRNAALLPPAYDFGQEGPLGFLWGEVSCASILTITEIVRQTGLSCCIANQPPKGQSRQTMDMCAKRYFPWPMRSGGSQGKALSFVTTIPIDFCHRRDAVFRSQANRLPICCHS